jgi:hypothetical protein
VTVQQEIGDRLDAIERWVDHARKAECSPRIALGAIEALAMAGLQHIGSNTGTIRGQKAAPACVEHPGPGQPLNGQERT